MGEWWTDAEPLISRGGTVLGDEIGRFDPAEARGYHGQWVKVGKSSFTFDGPAGGDGHMRAIMAVADNIERTPNGGPTAHAVRESAKAMYRRDMPAAYTHLDSAAYLDGVSGSAASGAFNRDDIEAIRRSYAKVPKGAIPNQPRPAVWPELAQGQQGKLKGKPISAGVVGTYARRGVWDELLHPRDPSGKWRKKAGELDKLAGKVQQQHHALAFGTGGFQLDAPNRNRAAVSIGDAADALRHGDLEKAALELHEAHKVARQMPGKRSHQNAQEIAAAEREIRNHLTDKNIEANPAEQQLMTSLAEQAAAKHKGKKHRGAAAELAVGLGSVLASIRAELDAERAFNPHEPRDPAGKWRGVGTSISHFAHELGQAVGAGQTTELAAFPERMIGDIEGTASKLRGHRSARHLRNAAGALRRGDREGGIRHLTTARHHLETSRGPGAAAARQAVDSHLAGLMTGHHGSTQSGVHEALLGAIEQADRAGNDQLASSLEDTLNSIRQHGDIASQKRKVISALIDAADQADQIGDEDTADQLAALTDQVRKLTRAAGLDWTPAEYLMLLRAISHYNPHEPRDPSGKWSRRPGAPRPGYLRKHPPGRPAAARRPAASGMSVMSERRPGPVAEPSPQELAGMVDQLHSKLNGHVAELEQRNAEQARKLAEVTDQLRHESELLAHAEATEAKVDKRKMIVRSIVNVLGLAAVAALILITGGVVDMSPLAEAGVAVGPLIGSEVINAINEARKRRRGGKAKRSAGPSVHDRAVEVIAPLVAKVLGVSDDDAAQLADDLVSDAEEQGDAGTEAGRTFH